VLIYAEATEKPNGWSIQINEVKNSKKKIIDWIIRQRNKE
jgi:hypothetical protein